MKSLVLVALVSVLVVGCKPGVTVTGENGEKISTDTQGNMSVKDDKGNTTDIKTSNGTFDAKSSNGAEVHMDGNGITTKDDKGGTFSAGVDTVSESELGLPFYPGSSAVGQKDMKANSNGKKSFISYRTTTDAPQKVADFYKDKIEKPASFSSDQMATIGGKLKDGRAATVVASATDGKTTIQVSSVDN